MMTSDTSLDLFAPPRARSSDPWTSHAAAASVTESAETQRRQILHTLRIHGSLTADEIDARLGWRETTAGRRLGELERKGLVVVTAEARTTRSGRAARVYAAVNR